MSRLLDRTGQRFGRLVALGEAGRDNQGRAVWMCRCDCGTDKAVPSRHLGSGAVVSCGCYVRELAPTNGRKGAAKHSGPLSPLWKLSVNYAAAHARVRTARGAALNHCCADCGEPARHWSYDLSDRNELTQDGLRYSLDVDRYVARCVRCHSAHDRAGREIQRLARES